VDAADVARLYVELWYATEREDELRSLLTDGFVHHTPSGDFDKDGFLQQLGFVNAALSDIDYAVVHSLAAGDLASVYVAVEATHSGDFFGTPETGKRVSTAGACFLRVEDGRIAEDWDAWSLQTILFQLQRA
jgi:predicted ester cyclase